jgi:hypothetical protein
MGIAPPEMHVLDFTEIKGRRLSGRRYRIVDALQRLDYCFDSTPVGPHSDVGHGALFVKYKDGTDLLPPLPTIHEGFHCPVSEGDFSEWSFTLHNYPDRSILVVLVLPRDYTSPVNAFNIVPSSPAYNTNDSRMKFLFIHKPLHGHFLLWWRTAAMKFGLAKELDIANDVIAKIPRPVHSTPVVNEVASVAEKVAAAPETRGHGRTVWDVVVAIWSRLGWRSLLISIPVLLALFFFSVFQTEPGKRVSFLGIDLYTKGGSSGGPSALDVGEIRNIPNIPGGAGWLFLGYFDPRLQAFTSAPLYKVSRTSFGSTSVPLPREGEWLQLLVDREVIIADFQKTGTKMRDEPPWQLHATLQPEDYTGITLRKGSVVEVREIAPGQFPGQSAAVWVKIGRVPQ